MEVMEIERICLSHASGAVNKLHVQFHATKSTGSVVIINKLSLPSYTIMHMMHIYIYTKIVQVGMLYFEVDRRQRHANLHCLVQKKS